MIDRHMALRAHGCAVRLFRLAVTIIEMVGMVRAVKTTLATRLGRDLEVRGVRLLRVPDAIETATA